MSAGSVVVGVLTHRDPPMVRRLVNRIVEGSNSVALVHHDPRGPQLDLPLHDRILRVSDAAPAGWGRRGGVEAQLRTLERAWEMVPDLAWFLLVSGQDYPILHMDVIESQLAASEFDAFVQNLRADGDPADDVRDWQGLTRRRYLRRRVLPGTHRAIPMPRRHPFHGGTRLMVGANWVNLNRRCVEHVVSQRRRRPELEAYLTTCANPDEAVLQSLLLNDRDDLVVSPDMRRFIKWGHEVPHPELLGIDDLPAILASTAWFARKVDPAHDLQLLDRLDDHARRTAP